MARLRELQLALGGVGAPGWEDADAHLVVVTADVPAHDLLDEVRRCFVHHWVPDEVHPGEESTWVAVVPEPVAALLEREVGGDVGALEVVRLEDGGVPVRHEALCALGHSDVVALMAQVLWDQSASSTSQLVDVADGVAAIAAHHRVPWWGVLAFVPNADCADLDELAVLANAAWGPDAEVGQ